MPDDLQGDIQAPAEDIAADSEVRMGSRRKKPRSTRPIRARSSSLVQAEALARDIAAKTAAERELVVEANGDGPTGIDGG